MFKKISILSFVLLFHIIFFTLGYITTTVDFSTEYGYMDYYGYHNYYDWSHGDKRGIVILSSILLSVLIFIIWLAGNNFKSSFSKNKNIVIRWLFIAMICFLNSTYYLSISLGQIAKKRSYVSKEEVLKHVEILNMTSLFIFQNNRPEHWHWVKTDSTDIQTRIDTFTYKNKKYASNSLLNRQIDSYLFKSEIKKDSLTTVRIKNWLYENQKDSVQWLMDSFFKIVDQHHLQSKTNITSKLWFEKTYNYPDFDSYTIIYPSEKNLEFPQNQSVPIQYYIPHNRLKLSYLELYEAWDSYLNNPKAIYILLFLSINLSLLIVAFKEKLKKKWLVTLLILTTLSLFIGLFIIMMSFMP